MRERESLSFFIALLILWAVFSGCQPLIPANACKEMCAPNNVMRLDHESCVCEAKR